jgi:hypothetical protein
MYSAPIGSNDADTLYSCGQGNECCSDWDKEEYIVDGYKKWIVTYQAGVCIRWQRQSGTPGLNNGWKGLAKDKSWPYNWPPCGGSWDCAKARTPCGYNTTYGQNCYCRAYQVQAFKRTCQ